MFNFLSLLFSLFGLGWLSWYALFSKKNNGGKWTGSYSATWSLWNKKIKDRQYNWGLYVMLSCLTFILPAYHLSSGWFMSALAILAIVGLFSMGCFPSGVNSKQTKIHVFVTQVAIISALIWALVCNWWLVPVSMLVPGLLYLVFRRSVPQGLIIEWFGFISVYTFLLVEVLLQMF